MRQKIKAEITKQLDDMDKRELDKIKKALTMERSAEIVIGQDENEYGLVADDLTN